MQKVFAKEIFGLLVSLSIPLCYTELFALFWIRNKLLSLSCLTLHPEHLVLTALGSFWQAEQIKWEKKNTIKPQTDFSTSSIMSFVLGWDMLVWENIMLLDRAEQCCFTAELCTGSVEAHVPGHGQCFCSARALLCLIFWHGQQHIPGQSREHLQLSGEACKRLSCRLLAAAALNRADQVGWGDNRDQF